MCFSRFLLNRQPSDGAAFSALAQANQSEALWWLLQTRQASPLGSHAELAYQVGLEIYTTALISPLAPRYCPTLSPHPIAPRYCPP